MLDIDQLGDAPGDLMAETWEKLDALGLNGWQIGHLMIYGGLDVLHTSSAPECFKRAADEVRAELHRLETEGVH